jgi:hypothetical protein
MNWGKKGVNTLRKVPETIVCFLDMEETKFLAEIILGDIGNAIGRCT